MLYFIILITNLANLIFVMICYAEIKSIKGIIKADFEHWNQLIKQRIDAFLGVFKKAKEVEESPGYINDQIHSEINRLIKKDMYFDCEVIKKAYKTIRDNDTEGKRIILKYLQKQ